jgi:transposase-like protein
MKKRVYDEQFRKDALGLVKRGRSARTVSEDLGVPLSTVLYWCTMAKKKGRVRAPATAPSSASDVESPEEEIARLKEENAKLRKKNAELEMDRAILKKAAASSTGHRNAS